MGSTVEEEEVATADLFQTDVVAAEASTDSREVDSKPVDGEDRREPLLRPMEHLWRRNMVHQLMRNMAHL